MNQQCAWNLATQCADLLLFASRLKQLKSLDYFSFLKDAVTQLNITKEKWPSETFQFPEWHAFFLWKQRHKADRKNIEDRVTLIGLNHTTWQSLLRRN